MWKPTPQGVLDSVVAAWVIIVLGAVMTAILTEWASLREMVSTPFLVILGIAIYGIIMLAINQTRALFRREPVLQVLPQQIETITPAVAANPPSGEVADIIRRWVDDFSFQVKRNEVSGDRYFSFTVTQAGGNIPIEILRLKGSREQFITLTSGIRIGVVDQERLSALSDNDRQRIYVEIAMEVRRQKIASKAEFPQGMVFETRVLISELTQAKLLDRIDDVDYAVGLTILKFWLLLDEAVNRNKPISSVDTNKE